MTPYPNPTYESVSERLDGLSQLQHNRYSDGEGLVYDAILIQNLKTMFYKHWPTNTTYPRIYPTITDNVVHFTWRNSTKPVYLDLYVHLNDLQGEIYYIADYLEEGCIKLKVDLNLDSSWETLLNLVRRI